MKLIMIHGRGQEEEDEAYLKQKWMDTLNKGLAKSGKKLPSDITVEFPFYGRLIYEMVNEGNNIRTIVEAIRSGGYVPNEAKEIAFFEAFLGELAEKIEMSREEKAELTNLRTRKRGILNWDIVQELLVFLDTKKDLSDFTLRNVTKDVYLYLTVNSIKSAVNELVEKSFDSEPCVVVGHSLGSVVSYLVLKNNPEYNVKKFITVGSPLGLNSIRNYLEGSLVMPQSVKNGWFNAYDDADFVALNPLDKKHFNILPPIENKNDVKNHTKNRHSIDGYLDDEVVASTIYNALVS